MAKMSTNFTHADLDFANMLHYFDINKLKCFDQGDKTKVGNNTVPKIKASDQMIFLEIKRILSKKNIS